MLPVRRGGERHRALELLLPRSHHHARRVSGARSAQRIVGGGGAATTAAASASASRVRLRRTAVRRSELRATPWAPSTSAPPQPSSAAPLPPPKPRAPPPRRGCWSPSARRTTSRTRNLRAAGGRGHRIILATIELTKNWSSSLCLPNFDQNYSEKKTRGIPNLRSLKQAKNHQTNRNAEQERINPGFRTPNRTPKPKPQETPFFLLQEPKNRSGTASNWGGGGTR